MRGGNFGHQGVIGPGFCIDAWGAGPFVITVGERSWRFEDSAMFGPSLVARNGDISKNPWPPERSPFWRAHRIWVRQGRRTEADGVTCVWDEPRPMVVQKINSRNVMIIEAGEEDGRIVTAPGVWREEKHEA